MWVLGIELLQSGLEASTFTCLAILLASYNDFKKYCQNQNISEMNSTVFSLGEREKKDLFPHFALYPGNPTYNLCYWNLKTWDLNRHQRVYKLYDKVAYTISRGINEGKKEQNNISTLKVNSGGKQDGNSSHTSY